MNYNQVNYNIYLPCKLSQVYYNICHMKSNQFRPKMTRCTHDNISCGNANYKSSTNN